LFNLDKDKLSFEIRGNPESDQPDFGEYWTVFVVRIGDVQNEENPESDPESGLRRMALIITKAPVKKLTVFFDRWIPVKNPEIPVAYRSKHPQSTGRWRMAGKVQHVFLQDFFSHDHDFKKVCGEKAQHET
jgi:hypothetical protein